MRRKPSRRHASCGDCEIHGANHTSKNWLFAAFLIYIVWLPLPKGSNVQWAASFLVIGAFLLLGIWLLRWATGREYLPRAFTQATPILSIWMVWCVWVAFQLTPLPGTWISGLTPNTWEWYQAAGLGGDWNPLTVDAHATREGIFRSMAYAVIFVLVLLIVDTEQRINQFCYALVFSGTVQGFYGGFMSLSGLEWGFFMPKEHYQGYATGTFVNRNHLAGYLVICISVGIGLLLGRIRREGNRTARQVVRDLLAWTMGSRGAVRAGIVIMVVALVLTRSRMGNTSFVVALSIAGVMWMIAHGRASRGAIFLISTLVVVDGAVIGGWYGIDRVLERLEETSVSRESRDEVFAYTLNYIKDYPITGTGLGTFGQAFPAYQGQDVASYYDHAHNDYLQFIAESGITGFVLLGMIVGLSAWRAVRIVFTGQIAHAKGVAIGALMAIVALLVHITVDFNLQIPAIAGTISAVMGLLWVVLISGKARRRVSDGDIQQCERSRRWVVASLIGGTLAVGSLAEARVGIADVYSIHARFLMERADRNRNFGASDGVSAALGVSEWLDPSNPSVFQDRLLMHWRRMGELPVGSPGRVDELNLALADGTQALKLRPSYAGNWINLAYVYYQSDPLDARLCSSLVNAARAGGGRSHTRPSFNAIVYRSWPVLSDGCRRTISSHLTPTD